jgi:transposase
MARKTYDESFKRDAVRLLTDQGYSLGQASEALGVSAMTLSNWKKSLVPREQADLQAELKQLRQENQRLRMERDILKKAATFFAKEQA